MQMCVELGFYCQTKSQPGQEAKAQSEIQPFIALMQEHYYG